MHSTHRLAAITFAAPLARLVAVLPAVADISRSGSCAASAQLAAVERAEQRLREGTYGLSVRSGEPIPDDRLQALPTAELTIEEQRAQG